MASVGDYFPIWTLCHTIDYQILKLEVERLSSFEAQGRLILVNSMFGLSSWPVVSDSTDWKPAQCSAEMK